MAEAHSSKIVDQASWDFLMNDLTGETQCPWLAIWLQISINHPLHNGRYKYRSWNWALVSFLLRFFFQTTTVKSSEPILTQFELFAPLGITD